MDVVKDTVYDTLDINIITIEIIIVNSPFLIYYTSTSNDRGVLETA
ncbi:hypothetical protein LGL55_18725 [Clostridium tagluense]|nr:hypothetical protein [Clostridium tagluense]MCB2322871.1 hypothetical protein [Clostridium tagluense]MCB2336694.1 hypothetical protein [Clostridium tagluense]MCB2366234.1 hypothetical protein [Clostridium tagluense]